MHHSPITSGQPLTSADISRTVDALGERRAQLIRDYDLRPVSVGPLFRATADDIAEALRRLLDVGK